MRTILAAVIQTAPVFDPVAPVAADHYPRHK